MRRNTAPVALRCRQVASQWWLVLPSADGVSLSGRLRRSLLSVPLRRRGAIVVLTFDELQTTVLWFTLRILAWSTHSVSNNCVYVCWRVGLCVHEGCVWLVFMHVTRSPKIVHPKCINPSQTQASETQMQAHRTQMQSSRTPFARAELKTLPLNPPVLLHHNYHPRVDP